MPNPTLLPQRPRILLGSLLAASATLFTGPAAAQGEVNVYSARHYDTDLALYDEFTAATGIEVNLLEAEADVLIERVRAEGEFSPGDVLITVDAGRLWRAEEAGILAPIQSDLLDERLPDHLRDPEGRWFGLSTRARIIIYDKSKGLPESLSTYEDLADPIHRGEVCVRSSSNIYNISLLASIVENDGAAAAEDWAKGVVANLARRPQGNDTTQITSVASGECRISIVNTYYLARFAASDDPRAKEVFDSIGVVFPNQDDRGTHVNISGAGVLKYAPHRENAIRFIEYLTENRAQGYFANGNNEYPAAKGVEASSAVESLGTFKADEINVTALGENQAEAVRIFDRAGWR
ncbi:Fe(3+) ABC transporter substrate-binding protein [Parvularcula dongshanensis]|uniref:Iron(III) transport system substrate-binding protein n=1 Tax=Parvularcula dongshanensis TaxID=1173995 RepID=A0A840I4W1_9PROT|nr:Fe(3+) ABC transporter substrate-binding protein [Parvularcula dongshanensis]MBB4659402.1 iron(III) transport system substrate-binding protein [Parvularcula dongshanensis]